MTLRRMDPDVVAQELFAGLDIIDVPALVRMDKSKCIMLANQVLVDNGKQPLGPLETSSFATAASIMLERYGIVDDGGEEPDYDDDFPNAITTGVQDGITLTPRGDWDINASGTHENMEVNGYVVINANNVTLRNCRVTAQPGQFGAVIYVASGKTGVVIEYCDLDGAEVAGLKGVWVDTSNGVEIGYCDISACEDGIYAFGDDTNIHDNYIHDLVSSSVDPHYDCIQFSGTGILIEHNSLIGSADQSSIAQFGNATGPIEATFNNNLMRPGECLVLLNNDDDHGEDSVEVNVTNNHMQPGLFEAGNPYWTYDVNLPATWTGNVDADTLEPIPPPEA